jgi:hypothetical protein
LTVALVILFLIKEISFDDKLVLRMLLKNKYEHLSDLIFGMKNNIPAL